MVNKNMDFDTWKQNILSACDYTLLSCNVSSLLSISLKLVNKKIATGELRGFKYQNRITTSKIWMEEFMDANREYYNPHKRKMVFPVRRSEQQKGLSKKRKRGIQLFIAITIPLNLYWMNLKRI